MRPLPEVSSCFSHLMLGVVETSSFAEVNNFSPKTMVPPAFCRVVGTRLALLEVANETRRETRENRESAHFEREFLACGQNRR